MRRVSAIFLAAFLLLSVKAEAVTVQDILDLHRAGLGDEVLLALIEVDGGVFAIDNATLTNLKRAGVSDQVIEALVRSGRHRPLEAAAPVVPVEPPPPPTIVIEQPQPVVQQVVVPVPVYVAVPVRARTRRVHEAQLPLDAYSGFGARPLVHPARKPAEPVYWGWGGKLRPDAWKPADAADRPPTRRDPRPR